MEEDREIVRETAEKVLKGELAVKPAGVIQDLMFTAAYDQHAECRHMELVADQDIVDRMREVREDAGGVVKHKDKTPK